MTSTVETSYCALSANGTSQRAHQGRKFLLHGVPLGCEIVGVWSLEEKWRDIVRSAEGSHLRVDEMDATISIPCGTAKPGKGNISMIAAPSSVAGGAMEGRKLHPPCCQPVPVVSASIVPRLRLKTQALSRRIVSGLSFLHSAARFHIMLPPINASFFGDYTKPGSTSECFPTDEGMTVTWNRERSAAGLPRCSWLP